MGGCFSGRAASRQRLDPARAKVRPSPRLEHVGREHLVLKLLAEVNTLSSDEGPLRWQPYFSSLVPLTLHQLQLDDSNSMHRVSAIGVDGKCFEAFIRSPDTHVRMTSQCFVQWRDDTKDGVWGLNFMSDADTLSFMRACSPNGEIQHSLSSFSLSVPIPSPPTVASLYNTNLCREGSRVAHSEGQDNLNTSVMSQRPTEELNGHHGNHGEATSYSSQEDVSVDDRSQSEMFDTRPEGDSPVMDPWEYSDDRRISDIDTAEFDDEIPELFRPSSPFDMSGNFILEDIVEDPEGDLDDSIGGSPVTSGQMVAPVSSTGEPIEPAQGWIEYAETNFSLKGTVAGGLQDGTRGHAALGAYSEQSQDSQDRPPSLPVSPPPGPTLSPRFSIIISDGKSLPDDTLRAASSMSAALLSGLSLQTEGASNRYSVISLIDDVPPPLPSSPPPGKLMSPRQSILDPVVSYDTAGNIILTYASAIDSMDMDQLSKQINNVVKERERELLAAKVMKGGEIEGVESCKEGSSDSSSSTLGNSEEIVVDGDLPPPLPRESDGEDDAEVAVKDDDIHHKASRLKSAPSFLLKTFDPPTEYSDSGFPESEQEASSSTANSRREIGKRSRSELPGGLSHGNDPVQLLGMHRNYSLASTSDAGYTESSGMKTPASSGSMLSETTLSRIDDELSSTTLSVESHSQMTAPIKRTEASPTRAAKHTMRKAGSLEVKALLVCKNRKVAMASKRKWKRYWVTLKGCSLHLYVSVNDDSTIAGDTASMDAKLDLEQSLAHAVHDHVKRDHLLCLSTANGNTYYLQTTNQADVEDWITAIHCAAAIAFTLQANTDDAERTLLAKTKELSEMIEKENQLKNMTELSFSALTDPTARSMASKQVRACVENIEKCSVDLYRMRCYMASLQGTELPNPQSLMSSISKPTKLTLSRVGMFSVSSLHAIVAARHSSTPSTTGFFHPLRSWKAKRSSRMAGTGRGRGHTSPRSSKQPLRSLEISHPIPLFPPPPSSLDLESTDADDSCMEETCSPLTLPRSQLGMINLTPVRMPSGEVIQVAIRNDMTASDVLLTCCTKHQLNPRDHFLRLKVERGGDVECQVPSLGDRLTHVNYSQLEICQKCVYTVVLSKEPQDTDFGFSIKADRYSRSSQMASLCVDTVEEGGPADGQGIREGDEILLINDTSIIELGWGNVEDILRGPTAALTLRSCMVEQPLPHISTSRIVESLICPAPPRNQEVSSGMLQGLIVPMPSVEDLRSVGRTSEDETEENITADVTEVLLKDTHTLSKLVRAWKMHQSWDDDTEWTTEDKMRKIAQDLLETEREYIRHLDLLNERYLIPLKKEKIIAPDEADSLCGNIPEITILQKKILNSLEEIIQASANLKASEGVKSLVSGIAGVFICHADHFRVYTTFCMSYHKVKKIMAYQEGSVLDHFLSARNPQKNPLLKLDALLAKPIVRISRYPLYLGAMLDYIEPDTEERMQLQDALDSMARVADHINEMKRISDTYYSLFEEMLKESKLAEYGVSISISQLLYHGQVLWLNTKGEQVAKQGWKKGLGPPVLCFVFKTAIILLYLERKFKRRGSKPARIEETVTMEDVSYKALLPCVQCSVNDLPDSDGVTNMWQLHYHRHKSSPVKYLLRSQSIEQKSTMVHLLQHSIKEQQEIYRRPLSRGIHHPLGVSHSPLSHSINSQPLLRAYSASHVSEATTYLSTCTDTEDDY